MGSGLSQSSCLSPRCTSKSTLKLKKYQCSVPPLLSKILMSWVLDTVWASGVFLNLPQVIPMCSQCREPLCQILEIQCTVGAGGGGLGSSTVHRLFRDREGCELARQALLQMGLLTLPPHPNQDQPARSHLSETEFRDRVRPWLGWTKCPHAGGCTIMFSYLITLSTKIKRDVVQTWGGKHPRMTYGETSELQCKR